MTYGPCKAKADSFLAKITVSALAPLSRSYPSTSIIPTMPALSVHQYDSVKSVLDTIERQFTIADDALVDITRRFLTEVKDGLNSYGKDMAMMCVLLRDDSVYSSL